MITEIIRTRNFFNILLILIIFVYYYTSFINCTVSIIIPLIAVVLWFFISMFTEDINTIIFSKESKWWVFYMALCFMMTILGISSSNINFHIASLPLYTTPIIGYYVVRNYNNKELKLLLFLLLVVYLANIIQNIMVWRELPDLFGDENESSAENYEFMRMLNIAPTAMVATSMVVIGTMVVTIVYSKKLLYRFLSLSILLIVGFYVFIVSARATSIVMIAFMLLGFMMAIKEPNTHKKSYYFSRYLILFCIGFGIIIPTMTFILQSIENERLLRRFNDIFSFLQTKGNVDSMDSGSFSARIELWGVSISSWLSNPITFVFGIGDHTVSIGEDLRKSGIGGHSEIWDLLGKYGLLGAFIFYKIFKLYHNNMVKICGNSDIIKYVNFIIITYLIYGFFNHIINPIILLYTFLIFPVIIKLLVSNTNSNYSIS